MPVRVQRKRTKGWRMPPGAIYVGRPTKLGNPFRIGIHGTAQECMELYGRLIDPRITEEATAWRNSLYDIEPCLDCSPYWLVTLVWAGVLEELRGYDLACWCPLDQPCHADVLLELANEE